MLIDTHCHINCMVKKDFDTLLEPTHLQQAQTIVHDACNNNVTTIINVGTSLIESQNCITLAKDNAACFAAIGIHPNDLHSDWLADFKQLISYARHAQDHKIVAIGECGLDFHYPDYNKQRQHDAFKAQIELALEYNLALVVHSRDAFDETLYMLEHYRKDIKRAVIHCFSYDMIFAAQVIAWNYYIGLGGAITYPKNDMLRLVAKNTALEHIVLETDAPFLPPQSMRGKQNSPSTIKIMAQYLADLRHESFDTIATQTTVNAQALFKLK